MTDPKFSTVTNIPTTPDAVAVEFDELAGSYDEKLTEWQYVAPTLAAQMLLAHGADVALPVLDAGCGTGWTGRALHAHGFVDSVGVDVSAESLTIAAKENLYRALYEADLYQPLPFADGEFGSALCIGVLTYVDPAEGFLRELLRVTAPGAPIVLTQRDDLFVERGFGRTLQILADEGVCSIAHTSKPSSYLPGHADYGEKINVIYSVLVRR